MSTKASGEMAEMGEMVEMCGMDWSTMLARKTTLERRVNCRSSDLGRKVMRLYLAVSISLWGSVGSLQGRRMMRDSSLILAKNMPIKLNLNNSNANQSQTEEEDR